MVPNRLLFEMDVLRPKWGWFLFLGILMATLGTIALLIVPAATIGTALVVGWLLVFSGIIEMVHAFQVRRWGGLFLHLIGGLLGLLIGLLVVTHPVAGALAWTLLFASFLTVMGLFRLTAAVSLSSPAGAGLFSMELSLLAWEFYSGSTGLGLEYGFWACQ